MSTQGVLRILLSLAVGGALVALLLTWSGTPPRAILDALQALDPKLLGAALLVQGLIYPLRALRFRALLQAQPPASLRRLIPATAAHSLVAYLLPAKLGEASLILYLERGLGVERARGLAVLLVARALDFAGVTLALTLACLVIGALDLVPTASAWLLPLGGMLIVPALLLTWVALRGASCVAFCRAVLTRTRITSIAPGAFLDRVAAKVEAALREVSAAQLLRAALWTVPIWALVFAYYGMLARGLGLDSLGPFEAVFGASLAVLSNLLPINGFAGFGTQDGGWLFGYMAMGASEQAAMASGLAFHIIYIAGMSLFGIIGHAFAGKREL
ncbi:MAG: uncharacterized membrane protein YbhN (UPF0104 family) [Planctomycetota bacterium]|jgi:uncharacterized membrane protein YbhN (UPF0104 family)